MVKEDWRIFHLRNHYNINIFDKSTTQYVKNVMNSTMKHVNSMEQGMIELQEKVIESDNERLKQPISIDQFIQEFISTKKTSTKLFTF